MSNLQHDDDMNSSTSLTFNAGSWEISSWAAITPSLTMETQPLVSLKRPNVGIRPFMPHHPHICVYYKCIRIIRDKNDGRTLLRANLYM